MARGKIIQPMACVAMLVLFGALSAVGAEDPPSAPRKTEEDLQREAAIAEFTRKTKAANYPALFEKAAAEFNVPADILKGVAFAETRWEHLTWPPGENYSPDIGMPRPYGIMSLWSNEFFGFSLVEAASLIGQDPEELKEDPYQNIRGGAALLRKLYDENPKPPGTTAQDIESWRYAIVKYCGIPERDLSHQHGLDVYEFMNRGYHQYGIEWDARPVNLTPMREEVKRIREEERQKTQLANQTFQATGTVAQAPSTTLPSSVPTDQESAPPLLTETTSAQQTSDSRAGIADKSSIRWITIVVLVLVISGGYLLCRRVGRNPESES